MKKVGEGGFGSVYAAYDPRLDRRVALKLFRPEVSSHAVLAEARALAQLRHRNVVGIHDALLLDDGRIALAMEYVEGRDLLDWARAQRGERAWRKAVDVVAAVGAGLVAVHERGLVHRDVKPCNILVDDGAGRCSWTSDSR